MNFHYYFLGGYVSWFPVTVKKKKKKKKKEVIKAINL